jgi:hypothetical protein
MLIDNPRLFGIINSNRDYSNAETWGKNQFNSSFPASLACYMYKKGLKAVFLKADVELNPQVDYIAIDKLFNMEPTSPNIYFSFETQYIPFQKYVIGNIPRNDLVINDLSTKSSCKSSLEIKLTALPDNATCTLDEDEYGSEIVIRPDTIIYLACSIIEKYSIEELRNTIGNVGKNIKDWTQAKYVLPEISKIRNVIEKIVRDKNDEQMPVVMQPIWKTNGKSPQLADNCLDVFVWSDFGMLNLFLPEKNAELTSISRHTRTLVWLYKMLYDYCKAGKFDGEKIIDELSFNTKNDKAFSTNGSRTHGLMKCKELITPRIEKTDIKNIILGGGQNLLSPERRFDAIIYNSPDLFK